MPLSTETIVSVEPNEIDELGHVNNARFLDYFERGRRDWYNRCDPTLVENSGKSLGTVIVNININYRRECFAGDRLTVVTRPETRGRTSYVLHQEILNESEEDVADAKVTSVVMEMTTRKVVRLPEGLSSQFDHKRT